MEPGDIQNELTEKRIKNLEEARALLGILEKDALVRKEGFAKVTNQLNGGKPLDDEQLIKLGQGWRTNCNFRDASSTLEQVLIGYWRLLHDTTNLSAITVHDDDPMAETYAQIMSENFNRFIDEWGDGYVRNYLLMSTNHVAFGVGTGFFNDPKSPRWEVVRVGDLNVPPRAKADTESLQFVMIDQEMEISDAWKLIRTLKKEAASRKMGWNPDALRQLLWYKINGNDTRPLPGDFVKIEDNIRDNELTMTNRHGPMRIIHLYVKEFDGKISTYIFARDIHHGAEFLFDNSDKESRPETMRELLFNIFFEAGNGLFWGSKGFGQKNYQLMTIVNRLKSRAVDRTLIDGLNFRDTSDGGLTNIPIVSVGPINVLPKELEQIPAYPHGSTITETIEMLDYQTNSNNARFRDQSKQIEQADTATQANALSAIQSQVDISNATLFLKQIAMLFSEQFRRLRMRGNDDPDAKKFRDRCIEEGGVPEEIFYDADITVATGADPGAASIALRAQYAKEGMMMAATDPDFNSRWFKEIYVSAHFGASAIKKALKPVDATSDIAAQRLAILENDSMGNGHPIPVDPTDNHAAHVPVHLQPLEMIVMKFKTTGQISPDAFPALINAIPHLQKHFEYMENNKLMDPIRKQLWPRFTAVESAARGILSQLQKIDAQARQQGMVQTPGGSPPGTPPPGAAPGGINLAGAAGAISQQQQ
jgi:hypothetical protein